LVAVRVLSPLPKSFARVALSASTLLLACLDTTVLPLPRATSGFESTKSNAAPFASFELTPLPPPPPLAVVYSVSRGTTRLKSTFGMDSAIVAAMLKHGSQHLSLPLPCSGVAHRGGWSGWTQESMRERDRARVICRRYAYGRRHVSFGSVETMYMLPCLRSPSQRAGASSRRNRPCHRGSRSACA